MATTIEAVFEAGVFSPLRPVSLPEQRRVQVLIDDRQSIGDQPTHPRLQPMPYPDDHPDTTEADYDYRPVPPKHVVTVQTRIVFAGRHQPIPYPEDDA